MAALHDLVHRFYVKIRTMSDVSPIFAERITIVGAAPGRRMVTFWSSVGR